MLKEYIAKLNKELAALHARQEVALKAADAEGISAEDREKHLAEFDRLKAEAATVKGKLDRATALADEQAAVARTNHETENQPAAGTPNIRPRIYEGGRPVADPIPPEQLQHHGLLQAFRGANAAELGYQAGLWVAATMYGHIPSREAYRDRYGDIRATMSTTNNSGAAYFVPEVIETSIIELAEQFGVFRRYAELVPMGSDTQTEPRWTGGLTAYFVSEGEAPSSSDPAWDKVGLTAKNLAAFGKMSRNLNEDAIINLGDKWAMAAAVAFVEKEDDCGFNGTGTSAYGGMTGVLTKLIDSANAASLYTATGHSTLATLTIGDFDSVMGKIPEYPGIRPAWFMHKTVYHASMGPLKNAAGGATPADLANGGQMTYGGYPVVFTQKMPKASSVTSGVTGIVFGDLSMAAKFGSRRGRTFETGLDGNDFSKQLMSFMCTQRFDINVHTVVDPRDSSSPGPVIGLKLG